MTSNKNLIAVVVLVLFATSLLISSLDYSSDIISSGGVPESSYSYAGNNDTSMNHTLGNASGAGHPAEKNGGNTSDPWAGLFAGDPGNGSSSADVRDSGNTLLIIGLVAAAIAVIAVVAFLIIRRRRNACRISTIPTTIAPILPAPVPDSYEGLIQLQFPQIHAPFPLTWGAGEPLELVIACKEEAIGEAMLTIDGGEARKVLLENGMATVSLKLDKGYHKVTVSAMAGASPSEDSWASVRIVEYREEIVRMFNDMCRRFTPSDDLTPRELERSLGAQLPETKQKLLGAAVTTFEQANYSLHEIRRTDFERMYTSEMGVL
ncbi:MAG TPA: DUF4129 domain-containing protein [Methanocella sp.]|jgi:hypothetical protein